MKILIAINHPSHYHMFKNSYRIFKQNGNDTVFVIKDKDIIENLLKEDNIEYIKINKKRVGKSKMSIILLGVVDLIFQDLNLFKFVRKFKPDIMLGTDYSISHIGKLLKTPSLVFNEDDFEINKFFCKLAYPLCSYIIAPEITNVGRYKDKKIGYNSFQKLAFLHPNKFTPNIDILNKYDKNFEKPYVLIRLVNFKAGHDIEMKHQGINIDILKKVIKIIENNKREVFISSESNLSNKFDKYKLNIKFTDIHHIMSYADLIIADSQSMIVESAILGVPNIRFNSFVGKINVLEELENKYGLTYGILPENEELLLLKIDEILKNNDNIKKQCNLNKIKMLEDKIDLTAFIVWMVENYPESVKIIKENPNYQYNFK